MGIYLEMSYDNSDSQSDYFDPFHGVGVDMLLGIVSSQAQTQALFRSVVDRYPELANLAWDWKTENYSMGRGNYLVSPFFSIMDDKGEVICVRYSVRAQRGAGKMYAYCHYRPLPESLTATGSAGATVRRNEAKGGIEIKFADKPDDTVLANLRSHGFRWSFAHRVWWKKFDDCSWAWAQGTFTTPAPETPAPTGEQDPPVTLPARESEAELIAA